MQRDSHLKRYRKGTKAGILSSRGFRATGGKLKEGKRRVGGLDFGVRGGQKQEESSCHALGLKRRGKGKEVKISFKLKKGRPVRKTEAK